MIEYLEYIIEKYPEEAYVGGVRIKTGDEWFDELDERVSSGEAITPEDLGLSKEDCDRLRKKREQFTPPATSPPSSSSTTSSPDTTQSKPEVLEDVEDTYT